ncbi:hypothetical protein OBE_08848, partial [human gut metagenome]
MLQTAPWVILAPGLAIFLTVLVCNLLGEAAEFLRLMVDMEIFIDRIADMRVN